VCFRIHGFFGAHNGNLNEVGPILSSLSVNFADIIVMTVLRGHCSSIV